MLDSSSQHCNSCAESLREAWRTAAVRCVAILASMATQHVPNHGEDLGEADMEQMTQAHVASAPGLDWPELVAGADAAEHVKALESLHNLSKQALHSSLLRGPLGHRKILLILGWWPYLSQNKDRLLLLRVLQKVSVTAEDLTATGLPDLVECLVKDTPDYIESRVRQLLHDWTRLLRHAER